jgi:hypothetical protein
VKSSLPNAAETRECSSRHMLYLITNWILELCLSLLWRLLIQEGYQGYLDMEIPLAARGLFLCCDYPTLTFGSCIVGFCYEIGYTV